MNNRPGRTLRRSLTSLAAVAVIGLASACGGSDDAAEAESLVSDDDQGALASEVPEAFSDGITVATQADIAPLTYVDDAGEVVGFDQDMLAALSDVMGVEIDIQPVTFENLILGLESGTYDFVADTTITAERLEKYDMVSYLTSSYSLVTPTDAEEIADDETELCGREIGVVTGEVISQYITATIDPACESAGEDPVQSTEYKDFASTVLAVQSGNVTGMLVDTMTFSQFQTANGDGLDFNGPTRLNASSSGYSFLQGSDAEELAPVVQEAITMLVEDGTYADLLEDYNLSESGLEGDSELNPTPAL